MLAFLIEDLKHFEVTHLWFDARESAIGFYQRFGFSVAGNRFYKDKVPYFKMGADL